MASFIVITPVKDEERFMPQLIECVQKQSLVPNLWVIVDDGSVDGTAGLADGLAEIAPWCRVIRLPFRKSRVRGKAVVNAIKSAIAEVEAIKFDFIIKMDADVTIEADFFMRLVERMEANPEVGIAGPELLVQRGANWKIERMLPKEFVRGPLRIYRRTCFEGIGGLVARKGWDGIDVIKALSLGWTVVRYDDLHALMHREIGAATGTLKGMVETGRGSYYMGATFLYMLIEASEYARRRPYLLQGLCLATGYLWGWLKGDRNPDPDVIRYIQKQHRALISRKLGGSKCF